MYTSLNFYEQKARFQVCIKKIGNKLDSKISVFLVNEERRGTKLGVGWFIVLHESALLDGLGVLHDSLHELRVPLSRFFKPRDHLVEVEFLELLLFLKLDHIYEERKEI